MSVKSGRNDPCRCGSGRKYKKCCLEADNAARALARDPAGEDEQHLEDDWNAALDLRPFDLAALRTLRYERGFFESQAGLMRGGGLEVTEWGARDIPDEVTAALDPEAVAELDGRWGDPGIATPIQVDIIELTTDDDELLIEIYNRGVSLLASGDDRMARLHRICVALDRAAKGGSGTTSVSPVDLLPAVGDFDMEALSRDHLTHAGVCVLCGSDLEYDAMLAHLDQCAPEHDARTGPLSIIVRLRATSVELPGYWLDLEMRQDAPLDALDRLLRVIWLECCGHLSLLASETADYFSRGYELNTFGDAGHSRSERTMATRLATAIQDGEPYFTYEYDFGSTTALRIEVTGHRSGRLGRTRARLLARNEPPVWPCRVCGNAATVICASCRLDGVNPFACDAHADRDMCGADAFLLPVVNSPRIGTCAYGADPDPHS